jgi:hypothetical protein
MTSPNMRRNPAPDLEGLAIHKADARHALRATHVATHWPASGVRRVCRRRRHACIDSVHLTSV